MKAGENPFRTERVLQVRYRLLGTCWEEFLNRCETMGYRASIVGPHGAGKTTLLEDLAPRLQAKGFKTTFLRLDTEHRRFPRGTLKVLFSQLNSHDVLLFDGAEQLHPAAWFWFRYRARRAGGLIVTTHRSGRLPTLWECHPSAEVLADIAARLLEVERDATQAQAQFLFKKHQGNLRDALREWYDMASTWTSVKEAC